MIGRLEEPPSAMSVQGLWGVFALLGRACAGVTVEQVWWMQRFDNATAELYVEVDTQDDSLWVEQSLDPFPFHQQRI